MFTLTETLLFSAIMGLSIFLSLPVILHRRAGELTTRLLTAVAIGILLFLMGDIFSNVSQSLYNGSLYGYGSSPLNSFGIENVLSGVRAILARELVRAGRSQKEIATILGTSAAAVTMYSKDRRGHELSKVIESEQGARIVVDNLLDHLGRRTMGSTTDGKEIQKDTFPLILDAAYRIMRVISSPKHKEETIAKPHPKSHSDSLTRTLLERLQEEQLAAQRNMALAVSTTDEVARTIFRQIASDSIRHAEIVSFLLSLPKNGTERRSDRIMLEQEISQIEAMIRGEESATEEPIKLSGIDPALKLLLKSMDIDEEKHKILLKGLLSINKARSK